MALEKHSKFEINNSDTEDGLFINKDGNGIALNIDTEATSADSINIDAVNTSGVVIDLNLTPGSSSTAEAIDISMGANCTSHAIAIVNNGTGRAITANQVGVLSASDYSLNIYSNTIQTNNQLVRFMQDNGSDAKGVVLIDNDGTGAAITIDNANATAYALSTSGGLKVGSLQTAYTGVTSSTNIDASHQVVNVTANSVTLTLPTAASIEGRRYDLKNSGTGLVTIATTSSQTIDGDTTRILTQYESITVVSDGSNWIII